MLYRIEVAPAARRTLRSLHGSAKRRIDAAILILGNNPRPPKAEKLKGRLRDYYRIRVRDFRIIYTIEDDRLVICIVKIGDRKDVYR